MNKAILSVVFSLGLIGAAPAAFPQDRPPDGEGAIFVDDLGRLNLFFADLQGDFMRVIFPGSPGDYVRLAPDGRYFLQAEDVSATATVNARSGDFYSGSCVFHEAVFVRCPVFDPFSPNFQCFFPAEGSAVLSARGRVKDVKGKIFDLEAHLTGIFLGQGAGFKDILNDIRITPTKRRTRVPPPVVPTHFGSVPAGILIALEEATANATGLGDTGVGSLSGLTMSQDGRLFGSLGFGGGGWILEIDSATSTVIGWFATGFNAVPGLDFAPPGTLYAGALFGVGNIGGGANDYFLFTLDTVTGATTVLGGPIGVPFVDSIVFAADGRLFGSGFVDGGAVLIQIDIQGDPPAATGRIIGQTGFTSVAGLEVASDGSLLGSLGGVDALPGSLIRIDPVTGAGSLIGYTGYSPVSGLARLPDMPDLAGM